VNALPLFGPPDPDGFTVETAEHMLLSDARFELHGGRIIVMSPARVWHTRTQRRIASLLERRGRKAEIEVGLTLAPKETRVLDVAAFRGDPDEDSAYFDPEEIALAVEVVSPSSVTEDYKEKPDLYASLGIPEFWRVDRNEDGVIMVEMLALDRDQGRYVPAKMITLDELEG
jgi:Uma2 family endonuclease